MKPRAMFMEIAAGALLVMALVVALPAKNAAANPGQSFLFLQSGLTQEIFGVSQNFMGGVAFAPDGDAWVDGCQSGSQLHRYDLQSTNVVNGTTIHPETIVSSNAGCGLTNHPDGTLYSNIDDGTRGVANLNASTGAPIRTLGPRGNGLGITVDPQTNRLVYVGADCRFTATCTIISLDPVGGGFTNYAVLSSTDAAFVDGIAFDTTGNFLFMSNRSPSFRLTILNRSGGIIQHVPLTSEPDGIALHATTPKFVVTNNTNGTITRFDFPNDDFTMVPVQTVFASGGFRGDLTQVGPDGCDYVTQAGTRYDNGAVTPENSLVRICPGFAPGPGFGPTNVNVSHLAGGQGEPSIAASFTNSQSLVISATIGFPTPTTISGASFSSSVYAYSSANAGGTWTPHPLPPSASAIQCAQKTTGSLLGDSWVAASRKTGDYYVSYLAGCNGGSDLLVARSRNLGTTWDPPVPVANGILANGRGPNIFHDKPMITVDNSPKSPRYGRVYVIWVADDGTSLTHLEVAWSDDRGGKWSFRSITSSPSCASPGTNFVCKAWAPYAAADSAGRLAVVWYDTFVDTVFFQRSGPPQGFNGEINFGGNFNDGGINDCELGLVNPCPVSLGSPGFGTGVPGGFGTVHLPINAQPDNGINPDPQLLVDNNLATPRYYALWTQMDTSGGSGIAGLPVVSNPSVSNIVLRTSTDGANWSSTKKVNDDNNDPNQWGSSNFFGQATLDPVTGALHVSFYSTRLDPLGKNLPCCQNALILACPMNCQTDVFHTVSNNGGESFSPDLRVTDMSSDESLANGNRCSNCVQYGDYEGITVQAGVAHPVWTDAREANFTAGLNEEVFTASVR